MSDPGNEFVTVVDLDGFLPVTVDYVRGAAAIRMATGWMQSATRLSPWPPNPVPEDLWAWTVELAGLVYMNPESLASRIVGNITKAWVVTRKNEILTAAAARYGEGVTPGGSFPCPQRWPEPAARWRFTDE